MPQSFGQWLIVILALLVGLLGGWVLRGLRAAASPTAPIVEGDPVAGVTEVNAPATATVDQDRPEAVVDEVPAPAAVTEEPTPAEYDAPPAAATLAANATVLPGSDTEAAEKPERVDAEPAPAEVHAAPVAAAEPVEIGAESVDGTAAPVVETEPVAVEEPATPLVVEDEPTERPATVPAPRAAVEDDLPPVAAADTAVAATPVASNAAESNGSATTAEAADDFRRIQGIGPKMAAGLQAAGIRTYQQLAELDEAALRETIKAAGLRATPSLATWPQQAKLLAGAGTDADRVLPVGADEQA